MTDDEDHLTDEARAKEIWDLEGQGLNQKQIAEELGVSVKTIQRYRKKPAYMEMWEANEMLYDKGLKEMYESDHYGSKLESIKEMGRRSRSSQNIMLKSHELEKGETRLTPEEEIQKIVEDRKRKDEVLTALCLAPWQRERLRLHFTGQPYEHVNENWRPPII